MNIGQEVKIIGGNNEIGQPTMMGKVGTISSVDTFTYFVKGKKTRIVYVDFEHFGTHCFNDYHLKPTTQQSLDKGDKITSNTLTITEEELENASYTSSTIESEGK